MNNLWFGTFDYLASLQVLRSATLLLCYVIITQRVESIGQYLAKAQYGQNIHNNQTAVSCTSKWWRQRTAKTRLNVIL